MHTPVPQDQKTLQDALEWYSVLLPDCKDAKKQAHWYRCREKAQEFRNTIVRGLSPLESAPLVRGDLYGLVRRNFTTESELDNFIRRLYFASDDRENGGWPPKRLAAWIASRLSGVARRRIEKLTAARSRNTRSEQ